jgi:lipopolysaccharide/colanic/teichoic acid biosynthesis glycosyltransferase
MITKRIFDLVLSLLGIVLLGPFFMMVAIWIKLDSPGPVFFRQVRVGQFGKTFRIFKFRTMCLDAETKGGQITVGKDNRITHSGRFLRRHKIDELPQLLNVVLGDMSLVGPRPEVPRYVDLYPSQVRDVILSVPPGITDFASIEYKDENSILGAAEDAERAYVEEVMPAKLIYYEKYVRERSLWLDLRLIFATFKALFR